MRKLLKSIRKSLDNKNYYSALVLSLIIPDICGKLEHNNKNSSKRYPEWFDKYLGEQYKNYFSGEDCYALRCSFLHEGSGSTENQKVKDVLDRFVFISDGAHCNRFDNCLFGDSKYDGKNFLQLSTKIFCQDIIDATNKWLNDVKDNSSIQTNMAEMLDIHEGGFSIGGAILIM
jgi:hypothetical protein